MDMLLGLGIIYIVFRQLDNMDDVSRLTDKVCELARARQRAESKA